MTTAEMRKAQTEDARLMSEAMNEVRTWSDEKVREEFDKARPSMCLDGVKPGGPDIQTMRTILAVFRRMEVAHVR